MRTAKQRARDKIAAKTRKAHRARRRSQQQPRAGVAALALSDEELDGLRWALGVVGELQEIKVECPEIRASCPECGTRFVAAPEGEHKVVLDDLGDVAALLARLLGKLDQGATLHFAKGGM